MTPATAQPGDQDRVTDSAAQRYYDEQRARRNHTPNREESTMTTQATERTAENVAAPDWTPCSALLLGPGVALTTPRILATCTRAQGHDGQHAAPVEWS